MELTETILTLRLEKERVERAIFELERLQSGYAGGKAIATASRRGRKSMGSDERHRVSERMKAYWAVKREATASGHGVLQ